MPAIPESTRSSITLRLLDHAEKNWPQLAKVHASYHGSFAYITGVLRNGQQIPLFRLRYGGSAHSFGFAIYSAASDRYQDALLRTGLPTGTPQEALDTACTVHLAARTRTLKTPDELTEPPTQRPDRNAVYNDAFSTKATSSLRALVALSSYGAHCGQQLTELGDGSRSRTASSVRTAARSSSGFRRAERNFSTSWLEGL